MLKRYKGAKVIADVKTSEAILDKIKEWGGNPILWKTGHSLIKTKMKEEDALLSGEMSGHMFFAENYYGFDDAIFGACKLIAILSERDEKLSDIIDSYPQIISTPEIRITVPEEDKGSIINRIQGYLDEASVEYSNMDGVRVKRKEGWWILRASNTQNCIIARVEGNTQETLSEFVNEVVEYLSKSGVSDIPKDLLKFTT